MSGGIIGGKTVVELRVHGVSGTPPESLLDCPKELLHQQYGDARAGTYRRARWIDDTISPPEPGTWRRLMEVYSWGGLTSGKASRAVWVLFLPFTLINLAHWMLPPVARRRPAVVVVALLRLLALSFTLTLLLAMVVVFLDITAWQCGSLDFCSAGRGPLAFLQERSTGVRLAVAAVPLVVVIVALWIFGREQTGPKVCGALPPHAVVERGHCTPLAAQSFWNFDPSVRRLRACHVTAWTAGLGAVLLAAPVKYTHSGLVGWVNVALLTVHLVVLGLMVLATASTTITGRGGDPPRAGVHRAVMTLRGAAIGILAVSLVWVGRYGGIPDVPPDITLPALYPAIDWLAGTQVVLLVAVFAGTWLSIRGGSIAATKGGEHYRPTLKGFTGPFVALTAWLLGGGVSVGFGLWAGQILGTLAFTGKDAVDALEARAVTLHTPAGLFEDRVAAVTEPARLVVPVPYIWTAAAVVLLIAAALVIGLYLWVGVYRVRRSAIRAALRCPPPGEDRPAEPCPVEQLAPNVVEEKITRSRALASLTDLAPRVIATLAALGFVLILAIATAYCLRPTASVWRQATTTFIAGAPVAIVIGLVAVVVAAVRNRQVRRLVAILWDVATFWPEANHPLTPPSYGGRTVWDLRARMDELMRQTTDPHTGAPVENRVVLVAHSQGTIIAAAALLQCHKPHEQYPLLTFGSPLRRLYARNFPAYFGRNAMMTLKHRVRHEPRWINLWALSDPIGSWVSNDRPVYAPESPAQTSMWEVPLHTDCRILDVAQTNPDAGEYDMCPTGPICGHSGFWHRREFDKAMSVLQAVVTTGAVDTRAVARPGPEAM
ncbi:hypothetical protein [Mycolicibacterium chubuense]|nr:hypothetical protein [Mycolicibacterium chubuense]